MVQKPKRKFSPEFKAEAVRLVRESEGKRSLNSIADELGVFHSTLANWVKASKKTKVAPSKTQLSVEERAELKELRREVQTLRMEREILKKATAFFAKENS